MADRAYEPNAIESRLWEIWAAYGSKSGLKFYEDAMPLMLLMMRNGSEHILALEPERQEAATRLAEKNLVVVIDALISGMERRYLPAVNDDAFFDVLDSLAPLFPFAPLTSYP